MLVRNKNLNFSIGLAIARRLGQDGCSVVVSSRKEENVSKAKKELDALGLDVFAMRCNVGKDEDRRALVKTTIDKFGGIDILVNNVAANPFFGQMMDVRETHEKLSFYVFHYIFDYLVLRGPMGQDFRHERQSAFPPHEAGRARDGKARGRRFRRHHLFHSRDDPLSLPGSLQREQDRPARTNKGNVGRLGAEKNSRQLHCAGNN
jgi:hypothetical protein